MITIDLNRIREGMPARATVKLIKHLGKTPTIECFVPSPDLSASDWKMVMDWQEDIIGKENISEFYAEETGRHWFIYLNRVAMEFINAADSDINSFVGMNLVENGDLVKQPKSE